MDDGRGMARDERDPAGGHGHDAGPDSGGFTFNLGAALDRLGSSKPASLADLVRGGDVPSPAPQGEAFAPVASEPGPIEVPVIREATPVDDPPHPVQPVRRPLSPPPITGPIITPSSTPVTATAVTAAMSRGGTGPVTPLAPPPSAAFAPSGAVAVLDAPAPSAAERSLPTLPKVAPVPAHVQVPAPANAPNPSPTTIPARTATRARPKRRVGLKAFLVLLVLGGLVAAGLVYGRAYLFPDEWDRDLVPLVDALETTTAVEFTDAVPAERLPVAEYDVRVADALFGAGWADQVAIWRALGLASGTPDATTLGPVLRSWSPAAYDPVTKQLAALDSLGGAAQAAALTDQLALVLLDQVHGANLATGPSSSIAVRAVIAHQARLTSDAASDATRPTVDRAGVQGLPAPLAYELMARADLGRPLAEAGQLELDATDTAAVAALPEFLGDALGDATEPAAPARLASGDVVSADAVQRGRGFWYLVFGAYLPAESAAAGADSITRELLTPVNRGEQACAYATFTGANPDATNALAIVAQAWVAAAPPEAGASTAVLDDGTVQLVSCDPGPAPAILPRTGAAAELVARQVAALAAS
jgi:hypothetical protein